MSVQSHERTDSHLDDATSIATGSDADTYVGQPMDPDHKRLAEAALEEFRIGQLTQEDLDATLDTLAKQYNS